MPCFRKPVKLAGTLVAALALLTFVLVFMEPTRFELRTEGLSLDQVCADVFWRSDTGRWAVDAESPAGKIFFYNGPKILLIALSVLTGLIALTPSRFTDRLRAKIKVLPTRRDALFLVLALALIPLACNRTKAVTNIYCPYEHTRYGGRAPYVRLWDEYPAEFKKIQRENPRERGRGFPAGHASGGFALMALAFVGRRRFWTGILAGCFAGWWMGLYQMARGAHYLSHTLTTWSVAWLLILVLAALIRPSGFMTTTKPSRR